MFGGHSYFTKDFLVKTLEPLRSEWSEGSTKFDVTWGDFDSTTIIQWAAEINVSKIEASGNYLHLEVQLSKVDQKIKKKQGAGP